MRFSTRRAGKVLNYNEDEEDEEFEAIVTDPNGIPADELAYETEVVGIDLILDSRPREGAGECISALHQNLRTD